MSDTSHKWKVYNDDCLNILKTIPEESVDLIISDSPWIQKHGQGRKDVRPNSSGTVLDYPTMQLPDIQKHLEQATSLCDENAVLFLWMIEKYLFEARTIAENCVWKFNARMT